MLRRNALRILAFAAAVLLLGVSVGELRSFRRDRESLVRAWGEDTVTRPVPRVGMALEREPDLMAARLASARAALVESLDARWIAELAPEVAALEAARLEARLERARADATEVFATRPASWEAPLILGGTAYLQRRRDGDLHRARDEWEQPLLQARALAPAHREPTGLLVAGQLALWHTLSTAEREATRRLLEEAFADEAILRRLLPVWAAVASSRDELVSVLPSTPLPWALLERQYTQQRDWQASCEARDRWRPLHLARLGEDLREGERRLEGGDIAGGRQLLLGVARNAPPSRQAAPLFTRALERLPPGPVAPAYREAFRGWLDWALPLWMMEQPSLPPATFRRLEGMVGVLPPQVAALVSLAGDELARAELLERRADRQWSPEWAPYLIAKARALAQRGELEEASATLARVHRGAQNRWAYRHLEATVGVGAEALGREQGSGAAGPGRGTAEPEAGASGGDRGAAATRLEAASWHGLEWQASGEHHHLELVPAYPGSALTLTFLDLPSRGGAVELSWNGVLQGCQALLPDRPVRLELAVEARPALLQARLVTRGRLVPGSVELEPQRAVAPGADRHAGS